MNVLTFRCLDNNNICPTETYCLLTWACTNLYTTKWKYLKISLHFSETLYGQQLWILPHQFPHIISMAQNDKYTSFWRFFIYILYFCVRGKIISNLRSIRRRCRVKDLYPDTSIEPGVIESLWKISTLPRRKTSFHKWKISTNSRSKWDTCWMISHVSARSQLRTHISLSYALFHFPFGPFNEKLVFGLIFYMKMTGNFLRSPIQNLVE